VVAGAVTNLNERYFWVQPPRLNKKRRQRI